MVSAFTLSTSRTNIGRVCCRPASVNPLRAHPSGAGGPSPGSGRATPDACAAGRCHLRRSPRPGPSDTGPSDSTGQGRTARRGRSVGTHAAQGSCLSRRSLVVCRNATVLALPTTRRCPRGCGDRCARTRARSQGGGGGGTTRYDDIVEAWIVQAMWTVISLGSAWRVASCTAQSTACRLESDPSTPTTSGKQELHGSHRLSAPSATARTSCEHRRTAPGPP